MRREDARHEVSERIHLFGVEELAQKRLEGWALNISRGGVRAIVEGTVELGEEYEVQIGEEGNFPLTRRGRVVWLQEEKDGMVAGIEFVTLSGAPVPPGPVHEA